MYQRLLTPSKAALLLAPSVGTASKCHQAGLLSLLGAGRIAVEQSANPFKQSALVLNLPEMPGRGPLPNHLVALEHALRGYDKGPPR